MNTPDTPFQKIGLLPYQVAFAANRSRFKIGLWARQTGKDHTATAEAVLDCMHNPGATWIIVAASERQALESLAKAKEWAAAFKFRIAEFIQLPAHLPLAMARTSSATEIKWSNGSRLIALPANAPTIRGYSANLILTEFAFHENPDAIWRAIYPAISNPLRGGLKKLRVISTPNGLNNKFAQLWHSTLRVPPSPDAHNSHNSHPLSNPHPSAVNLSAHPACSPNNQFPASIPVGSPMPNDQCSILNPQCNSPSPSAPSELTSDFAPRTSNLFHRSRITIHDAIAAGLPLDAAELQAGLNDPEAWAQEYLCEFMDNSTVLLPYDLIETCESSLATELSSPDALSASAIPGGQRPQLFAGIDFARKNHLTVCWILEKIPSSTITGGAHSAVPHFNSPSVHSSVPSVSLPSSLLLTREVLTLRNASTPEQLELLRPRLNLCQRVALDYTGPGIGLGDFLHRELNQGRAARPRGFSPASTTRLELCPFTSAFKAELFPRLAAAFENHGLLIPIARDIREDLHSLYRTVTNSGNILYRAHATADGHADRTTALALALRAAQTAPQSHGGASNVGGRNRGGARFRPSRDACHPSAPRTIAIIH